MIKSAYDREEAANIYSTILALQSPEHLILNPENTGSILAKTALTLAQIFEQVTDENPAIDLPKAITSYGKFESHGKITQLFNSFFSDDPRFSQGVKALVETQAS